MLTVYLDQNKWIDLARAETGHPKGEPFVETLAAFKQAVGEGRARFPLSAAHYYETGKQRDRKRRMELATAMVRLAGTLRIAPPHTIVPWEIQRALVEVFDLPLSVPDLKLLGSGVAHAFSAPTLRYTAPTEWNGIQLPPEWQDELERRAGPAFEAMLLASVVPEGLPDPTSTSVTRLSLSSSRRWRGWRLRRSPEVHLVSAGRGQVANPVPVRHADVRLLHATDLAPQPGARRTFADSTR